MPVDHRQAQDRAAKPQHRANRQINAADDQHQRHARRHDGQGRDAIGQGVERPGGQEVCAQRPEEQQQGDPDDDHRPVLAITFSGHEQLVLRGIEIAAEGGAREFFLRPFPGQELAGNAPGGHDQDAVAERHQLGQLA